MPLRGSAQQRFSLAPQGDAPLLTSEQLNSNASSSATNNFSEPVAIADSPARDPTPIVITFSYASVPSSVQYDIFVAMIDGPPLTNYTKIGSTTNVNGDQVTIQRSAAGGNHFRFVCVREVIAPGVNATVTASA